MHSNHHIARLLALALSFGSALAATSFELLPGAVVDPDRRAILVMQPNSGIAVLDAENGRERCSTRHAALPLLIRGSRVLAQTESGGSTLRLYILKLSYAGSRSDESCTLAPLHEVKVSLPTHVVTAIDERVDSVFRVRAWADSGPHALVEWSYRRSPAYPDSRAERGLFRVNLSTGAVETATAPSPPGLSRALPPVPTASPRKVAVGPDKISIAVTEQADGRRSVELDGKRLDVDDVRALRLASNDRSVLVSRLAPGAAPQERYVWSIYALGSGRKHGELRAGHSGSPFFIHDEVVVFREDRTATRGRDKTWLERPVRLVGRSLPGDGTVVWSYLIRDTAYRGTRPPRQP